MSPLVRIAMMLALSVCVFAAAPGAQAAKSRATPGQASSIAVGKPLKITPGRRATVARTAVQRPTARPKRAAMPVRHAVRTPAIKPKAQAWKPVTRKPVATAERGEDAEANASAIPLTPSQRESIYRIITERPLRPNPVVTERVLPPTAPKPVEPIRSSADAVPPPAIPDRRLKVGAVVPPVIALHPIPVGAVAAVPEIEPFRYAFVGDRVLLVDPRNGRVVAAINQ